MLRALLVLLLLIGLPAAAQAEARHVLKGRIIRALAVEPGDPSHILVGQKAGAPGSALVFRSLDGGRQWRTLNGNRPLSPEASDVQAVAALSKQVLLAGTWKHGLYVSHDAGGRFERVTDFPSRDVRDLAVVDGVVFAATARSGVFESRDEGRSWQSIGPAGEAFLWSLTATGEGLLASSPEAGVFRRTAGGWRNLFEDGKAHAAVGGTGLVAIAGEAGLHLLARTERRRALEGEKLADVAAAGAGRLIAGSWSNGLVALTSDGKLGRRLLADQTVLHVHVVDGQVLAGTWGGGLHFLPLDSLWP